MKLPDFRRLDDAELQAEHAAQQLVPLLEMLELRLLEPPTNPAHRPRYEQNMALLRALKAYFPAVSGLMELQSEVVGEMGQEMANAQFRYTQMGIERDYLKEELRVANERYYQVLDTLTALSARLTDEKPLQPPA